MTTSNATSENDGYKKVRDQNIPSDRLTRAKNALRKWFGISLDQHDAQRQFLSSLKSEVDILSTGLSVDADLSKQNTLALLRDELDDISRDLQAHGSWNRTNRVEKTLTSLFPDGRTRTELMRRIAEAERVRAPFSSFYKNYALSSNTPDATKKPISSERDVLQMIVTDLHWLYNQRYIKRGYSKNAIKKVSAFFFVSFVVFLIVLTTSPLTVSEPNPKQGSENTDTNNKSAGVGSSN